MWKYGPIEIIFRYWYIRMLNLLILCTYNPLWYIAICVSHWIKMKMKHKILILLSRHTGRLSELNRSITTGLVSSSDQTFFYLLSHATEKLANFTLRFIWIFRRFDCWYSEIFMILWHVKRHFLIKSMFNLSPGQHKFSSIFQDRNIIFPKPGFHTQNGMKWNE